MGALPRACGNSVASRKRAIPSRRDDHGSPALAIGANPALHLDEALGVRSSRSVSGWSCAIGPARVAGCHQEGLAAQAATSRQLCPPSVVVKLWPLRATQWSRPGSLRSTAMRRCDPGRAAEHGFQIRKGREGIEVAMHKGEIFDIRERQRCIDGSGRGKPPLPRDRSDRLLRPRISDKSREFAGRAAHNLKKRRFTPVGPIPSESCLACDASGATHAPHFGWCPHPAAACRQTERTAPIYDLSPK
jgi:hypothetical protein